MPRTSPDEDGDRLLRVGEAEEEQPEPEGPGEHGADHHVAPLRAASERADEERTGAVDGEEPVHRVDAGDHRPGGAGEPHRESEWPAKLSPRRTTKYPTTPATIAVAVPARSALA